MRRFLHIAAILMALLSVATAEGENTPKRRVPLADPFILLHDGNYYAYGTHNRNGIEYYISNDLKKWYYGGIALHKDNSYGNKWFWAPEVYHINGKFYMYYSAEQHICVATSDSPIGPFKQTKKVPMIPDTHAIDNTIFIDDDGTPYIFYVLIRNGFQIRVAELENDLTTIKPNTATTCIRPKQRWERMEGIVNEGPSIIKHDGLYYMLYSGNGYTSQKYGIGCAVANNIRGPWRKLPENPIFQLPRDLVGAGHGAPFYDKKGRMHYVFHAHNSREKIHPRCMYITRMHITNGRAEISDRFFTPTAVK